VVVKAVALLLLAVTLLAAGTATAACTRLTVTAWPDYPPVAWRTGDALDGAGIDLATVIADGAGLAVSVRAFDDPDTALSAVRDGRADLIAGVPRHAGTADGLAFVDPAFVADGAGVFVLEGWTFPLTRWEDLLGRRGTVVDNWRYAPDLAGFLRDRLVPQGAHDAERGFALLLAGQVDFMVGRTVPSLAEAARLGVRDRVRPIVPSLTEDGLHLAFGAASPCRDQVAVFAARLRALLDEGSVAVMLADAGRRWNFFRGARGGNPHGG